MKLNDKEQVIIDILKKMDSVSNLELSEMLHCSTVTIRSLIRSLEKKGLIIRTHGGAKLCNTYLDIHLPAGNIFKNREAKLRIAEKAYQYIAERDTVILDDSSNSYYLAQVIKKYANKYLVIITNSLPIIAELSTCPSVEVISIGGMLRGSKTAFVGDFACEMLSKFKVAKAFIGVHGIDPELGITSIGNEQMMIKKVIFHISKDVYVLTCSEKFGTGYLLISSPLDQIHKIITDKNIDKRILSVIKKNVEIDLV